MREIPLTKGMVVFIDDEDYALISQYSWSAQKYGNQWYAVRQTNRPPERHRKYFMHRVILQTPLGVDTDHINGNGLDNRRSNLRRATKAENVRNGRLRGGASPFKGVTRVEWNHDWAASIKYERRRIHLGYFKDEVDAAKAYNEAAIRLFGEFARLNPV